MIDLILYSKPFDWNDNLSEEAIEDFETIRGKLTYCQHQSIGMALAKLELLEKQGCKVIDPSGSSSEKPNKCDGAISKKAAIDAIYARYIGGKEAVDKAPANDQYAEGIDEAVCAVEDLPPVTPQPKTGHWIRVDKDKLRCSECEVIHLIAQYPNGKVNWCPNCGAKMVEPQEGGDQE